MRLAHHHRPVRPDAGHRRRGATIVEVAFVLPIFLTLVLGAVDVGFAVLQTSQATGAAADGARVGVLNHGQVDVPGSADREAVEEAVRARLAGQEVDAISVTCMTQSGSSRVTVSCAAADPDIDFVRVQVRWAFDPLSFVGAAFPDQDITGTATMAIVRQPTPSSSPHSP